MKKKVIFVILSLGYGGAERVIVNLANQFSKKYDVKLTTILDMGISYELCEEVNFLQFGNKNDFSVLKKIKNSIKLIKYIRKEKPDSIVVFCPTMSFVMCFAKIFVPEVRKAKLIISERNNPENEYKTLFVKFVANFLYSKANCIVFQTPDAMNFFKDKVRKRGLLIPNPLNKKFIDYDSKCKKENVIISVGRLEPQKNQAFLIKSFVKICDQIPDYILKIYGEGNLRFELEKLIDELGCKDKVFLEGESLSIEKELEKSKIFVLPSIYEGMPNSLMEAMAMGVACISTDCPCGGSKMLIKDKYNGLLVAVNDEDQMSNAILELAQNSEMIDLFSTRAKEIVNEFNPEIIYKKWNDII